MEPLVENSHPGVVAAFATGAASEATAFANTMTLVKVTDAETPTSPSALVLRTVSDIYNAATPENVHRLLDDIGFGVRVHLFMKGKFGIDVVPSHINWTDDNHRQCTYRFTNMYVVFTSSGMNEVHVRFYGLDGHEIKEAELKSLARQEAQPSENADSASHTCVDTKPTPTQE